MLSPRVQSSSETDTLEKARWVACVHERGRELAEASRLVLAGSPDNGRGDRPTSGPKFRGRGRSIDWQKVADRTTDMVRSPEREPGRKALRPDISGIPTATVGSRRISMGIDDGNVGRYDGSSRRPQFARRACGGGLWNLLVRVYPDRLQHSRRSFVRRHPSWPLQWMRTRIYGRRQRSGRKLGIHRLASGGGCCFTRGWTPVSRLGSEHRRGLAALGIPLGLHDVSPDTVSTTND